MRAPAIPSARGRCALVTGASAGIGEAFARALAAEGADLVLVARRGQRLAALAGELAAAHGIVASALADDLADPDAPARIAGALSRPVDILVSNAGRRDPGRFEERTLDEHRAFLTLMIGAGAHLTRLLLPSMQERRYGRIIHVASVAGLLPGTAGRTLYAASKAFLVSFSQSLAAENRRLGVHATALCPGFTWSEFHPVEHASPLRRLQYMAPERVARAGLVAVEKGRAVAVPGLYNRAVVAVSDALPRAVSARLVGATQRGRRAREAAR